MEPLRILIADDHPLFRKGLHALLAAVPEMEVVGQAGTGQDAMALAATLQPDVVLMDLQMPDGGGIAATRAIVQTSPQVRVLIVTLFEDDDSVFTAL